VTTRRESLFRVATALLLVGAAWLRIVGLDRLPGINGDETWYPVVLRQALAGDPLLRTPLGNPLNPLLAGPVLLLDRLFEPSFLVLRIPAVLSGAAIVAVAWFLLRRTTDSLTGWILTLLLAAAPVDLVYSRLAWDPSQVAIAAGVFLYFVRRRAWLRALLAFGAAVWIHPTSVFLAPLGLVPWVAGPGEGSGRRHISVRLGAVALGVAGAIAALPVLFPSARVASARELLARAVDPSGWLAYVRDLVRLFSGTTVYRYVVGSQPPASEWLHDAVLGAVVLAALAGWVAVRRRGERDASLPVAATGVALGVFYLVTGTSALEPGKERYALWCVVPVLFCIALGLRAWATTPRRTLAVRAGVCLLAAAALGSFQVRFLHDLDVTGGRAHRAFRTGVVEPKAEALRLIREASGGEAWIVAEDWWLYWPLRYLVDGDPRTPVSIFPQGPEAGALLRDALERRAYLVGFEGEEVDRALGSGEYAQRIRTVDDPAGHPILHVYRRVR